MDNFWRVVEAEEKNDTYERCINLFGELYFSPKERIEELDLQDISISDLQNIFREIEDIPTEDDSLLIGELNVAKLTILNEAFLRSAGRKLTWYSIEKRVKKNFF